MRVIDADSLIVDIDLGFNIHRKETVRVLGIDAPEMSTSAGKAARAFVDSLLPYRTDITLRTEKPYPHDKYGRYLAVVQLSDGRILSDIILEEGHAMPYSGGPR